MPRNRIALLSVLAWTTCATAAQDESARPSAAPDIRLTVRTKGDQTLFRIGEVIRLELAFTSTTPKKYQLDMASYDRSGRLREESFAVEPESGWDDPLYLYYHAYQGFFGGGLRGMKVLSAEPTALNLELNEWVRFQTPGKYRVTLTSGRATRLDREFGQNAVTLTSNELVLNIVPAPPQWQQETLQHALAVLDAKPAAPGQAAPSPDPRREALQTLRYLGTPAAARELARRLNDPECATDCRFGLIGSPARRAGLDEMKRLLADPDFSVTGNFLATMSVVALPVERSGDLPAERAQLEAGFRQDLVSALATKRGTALAACANTIVEDAAIYSRELPPELKRTLTEQLIANFDRLPSNKQMELMQSRWHVLDHQAMLPLLQKLASRYRDFPVLNEAHAWEYNNASGAALDHWYELDPAGARPAVLREILRPKPRFNASVLGVLPDRELPEVEQPLMEHLLQSQDFGPSGNIAGLIHRYASPAVEAQVSGYLDERLGKLACGVQEPLLAYMLKVDPASARSRIETAMAARGEGFSACNRFLLREVSELQNDPLLEDVAVKALDDDDPQVVGGAAAYLGEHGTTAAEAALWSHYTAWSQRWTGHEADLRYIPDQHSNAIEESTAGSNLMEALAAGQSWLADETKLRRLMQLSVGSQQHLMAEQWLKSWQSRPLTIQFVPVGKGEFQIVQYHLRSLQAAKDKLLQFPGGSTFQWSGAGAIQQDDAEQAFQALSSFAGEHGMKIVRSSNP